MGRLVFIGFDIDCFEVGNWILEGRELKFNWL